MTRSWDDWLPGRAGPLQGFNSGSPWLWPWSGYASSCCLARCLPPWLALDKEQANRCLCGSSHVLGLFTVSWATCGWNKGWDSGLSGMGTSPVWPALVLASLTQSSLTVPCPAPLNQTPIQAAHLVVATLPALSQIIFCGRSRKDELCPLTDEGVKQEAPGHCSLLSHCPSRSDSLKTGFLPSGKPREGEEPDYHPSLLMFNPSGNQFFSLPRLQGAAMPHLLPTVAGEK